MFAGRAGKVNGLNKGTSAAYKEFGKIAEVEFAQQIEKLRYASYTLERALVQGGGVRERLADVQLCVLVTTRRCAARRWLAPSRKRSLVAPR